MNRDGLMDYLTEEQKQNLSLAYRNEKGLCSIPPSVDGTRVL